MVQLGCGLLAGVAMVALQCLVVSGVVIGTGQPACGSSNQCHQPGTFCEVGVRDRCQYCGSDAPLSPQTDPTRSVPFAPDYVIAGFNLTAVAELCADPNPHGPTRNFAGDYVIHTTSSVVSWCKSRDDALGFLFFIPGP
jgi:hypothetical protein